MTTLHILKVSQCTCNTVSGCSESSPGQADGIDSDLSAQDGQDGAGSSGPHPRQVEHLTPRVALEALLGATLNLYTAGQTGGETLCQLADQVPVLAIRHNDSAALAQALTTNQL